MSDAFGISSDYNYFEFELDSWDATEGGSGASATSDWPVFTLVNSLTNVAAVKVIEVEIPFTWNVISSENSTFQVAYNFGAAQTLQLPQGTFAGTTMAQALANSLAALFGNGIFNVTFNGTAPITIPLSLTNPQGFLTISAPNPFAFSFGTGVTDDGSTNPRLWLGFNGGTHVASNNFGTYVLHGDFVAQLSGPNYLYLSSATLGPLCRLYLPQGVKPPLQAGGSGAGLAKIPVNTNAGGVIFWSDPDPTKYFDLQNLPILGKMDFYLTMGNTATQTPLRLNGANFSLKLGLLTYVTGSQKAQSGTSAQGGVVKRMRVQ